MYSRIKTTAQLQIFSLLNTLQKYKLRTVNQGKQKEFKQHIVGWSLLISQT